jgi:hypothetical protein
MVTTQYESEFKDEFERFRREINVLTGEPSKLDQPDGRLGCGCVMLVRQWVPLGADDG